MDSLKVLDPEGPIREADIGCRSEHVSFVPKTDEAPPRQQSKRLPGLIKLFVDFEAPSLAEDVFNRGTFE